MGKQVSKEFLTQYGFKVQSYGDDDYYIKKYSAFHYIQVDPCLSRFTEDMMGNVDELDYHEFIETVNMHDKAINGYS